MVRQKLYTRTSSYKNIIIINKFEHGIRTIVFLILANSNMYDIIEIDSKHSCTKLLKVNQSIFFRKIGIFIHFSFA